MFARLYMKRGAVNFALSRFGQSVDDYASALKQEEALTPAKQSGCSERVNDHAFLFTPS